MFGGNRRKATEHVVAQLRPLIAIVQQAHGLPARFWQDEFVIGFIGFMIGFHAEVTSGRRLSTKDKGIVLFDAFTALSNMNGKAIADRYLHLAAQEPKDPNFERGLDNASYCAFASVGKMTPDGQEHFDRARKLAADQGLPNDPGAIVGNMVYALYLTEIADRFE